MNTYFIPKEILNNPKFDKKNLTRINELNDMFKKFNEIKINTTSEDYKNLLIEINKRINAEYNKEQSFLRKKEKENKLKQAKDELIYLKSLNQ